MTSRVVASSTDAMHAPCATGGAPPPIACQVRAVAGRTGVLAVSGRAATEDEKEPSRLEEELSLRGRRCTVHGGARQAGQPG